MITHLASDYEFSLQNYNQLVTAYQQTAYDIACRFLGDRDRALDATQDAFCRGYRALSQFRGGSFKAWILRIVLNSCYDQLPRCERRPQTPRKDLPVNDQHSPIIANTDDPVETSGERLEFNDAIQTALNRLPDDQRVTVIMSDIARMSYEEIAAATGVGLGTVRSRLGRGRAKLHEYFRKQEGWLAAR